MTSVCITLFRFSPPNVFHAGFFLRIIGDFVTIHEGVQLSKRLKFLLDAVLNFIKLDGMTFVVFHTSVRRSYNWAVGLKIAEIIMGAKRSRDSHIAFFSN